MGPIHCEVTVLGTWKIPTDLTTLLQHRPDIEQERKEGRVQSQKAAWEILGVHWQREAGK